jgi:hypothetical protein
MNRRPVTKSKRKAPGGDERRSRTIGPQQQADPGAGDPLTLRVFPPPETTLAAVVDDSDDTGLDEPMPSAERLIVQAVSLADTDHDAASLVDRFWRFAADEELVGCTPQEMLAAARAHRELAEHRLPGELKLRLTAPGPGRPYTVIEIVTDDMPFLVDSVTALLTERHFDVHLLVHPLVVVRREPLGQLTEVAADVEPDDAIDGDLVESWIRIEIDPVRDAGDRDRLGRDLQRVLTDVREAVEGSPTNSTGPAVERPTDPTRPAVERPTDPAGPARCRCRRRTSVTRSSCCAGWPTTTSPSSATASTAWSTAATGTRRWWQCSAPGSASCARTRPGRGRWLR